METEWIGKKLSPWMKVVVKEATIIVVVPEPTIVNSDRDSADSNGTGHSDSAPFRP